MRIRQALALFPENLPGLCSLGNLQLFLALQRGHLDLLAERGLRKTDRNFADQVRTAAFEERMLFHVQKNVKVAGGPAVIPGSPCPAIRKRVPESTPAGTPTSRIRSRSMRPWPRHVTQASLIVCPAPWHAG